MVGTVEHEVPWRPGAVELLAELNRSGVPCALVTMSYRRFVAPILATLPDDAFATVVTGDTVVAGASRTRSRTSRPPASSALPPGDCLAIEDSNTGARSAVAAGCTVLVVPNHVPVLPGEGRVFAESLADVDIAAVWSGRNGS